MSTLPEIETSSVDTGESIRRLASTSSARPAHCELKRAVKLAPAFIVPLIGMYKMSFALEFSIEVLGPL
jgi:hypothetical protein